MYEFDTKKERLGFCGLLKDHFNHRFHYQRQPKVHTPLIQFSQNGLVYFGTDAGDESEYYLYGHFDEGYQGGYLVSYNPLSKELRSLGLVQRMGGTKSMILDQKRGLLYYTASPAGHLFRYDIKGNNVDDLGRINCEKVVRTLFIDKWGSVYGTTESGELVRYNQICDTIQYLNVKPFGGSTTGPSQVIYAPDTSYIIGYNGYSGVLSRYYPDSAGMGKVEELGTLFNDKKILARNLNVNNNRLYVVCTSMEEVPLKERFNYLLTFDLDQKKIVGKKSLDPRMHQAFGHPVMDKKGNMYLCGFWDASDYSGAIPDSMRVFLVKIDPKNE
jgi:hypothetical protein